MANSTSMQIFMVSLVVDDYDSAIEHYTKDWGFELLEDSLMDGGKRWVRVAPPGSSCCLLLAQARDSTQRAVIGQQAGGRVFLFMHVSDLQKQVQHLADFDGDGNVDYFQGDLGFADDFIAWGNGSTIEFDNFYSFDGFTPQDVE